MNTIENELNKNGIKIVGKIDTQTTNHIVLYVAQTLCTNFPELKLNYNALCINIASIPMYIAEISNATSGACYLYKNSSLYFRKGLSVNEIERLAVHECIHHLQEIKDSKGTLRKLGLCTYQGNKAYGNALNEAAVQMMAAFATGERFEKVTYYGITLPSDSPTYYSLICNLMKQIGYIVGFPTLFRSTFYSDDAFYAKFKELVGENNAFKIQENFEKILDLEQKMADIHAKVQHEELGYRRFKKCTDDIEKCRAGLQKYFLETQNLIVTSFFDTQVKKIQNISQIEDFRKYLYSFTNLIGTTPTYDFFNDYYIKKMSELDALYEKMTGNAQLTVVKKSKLHSILQAIRKLVTGKQNEYENN